jgi:protein NrfD
MPETFVAPPGWGWDIVLYFFVGGLAGGTYFLANMVRLVEPTRGRPISRIGYYLAFPLINVCGLLLIKDLGVPHRFWHMLLRSEELPALAFKWWSPISFGSWILLLGGVFMLISFVHALLESGIWGQRGIDRATTPLHRRGRFGWPFLVIGALWGLLLAGYTGMLLLSTNAPTWTHDPLLPALFMASGVATSAALLFLLAWWSGLGDVALRHAVLRVGVLALGLEVLLLVASLLIGIGGVSPFFLGWWAALFWLVILPFGVLAPLVLLFMTEFRGRELVRDAAVWGAALLLAGGLMLRLLEVLGGQAYFETY